MAAPNMLNANVVIGTNSKLNVTTILSNIVTNTTNSNTLVKLNALTLANYSNAAVMASVTILSGSTVNYLAGGVTVPANATLMPVSKDNVLYLIEGDSLQVSATSNSSVWAVCSYEVVS